MEEFERGQRVVIGEGVFGTVVREYTTAREERMIIVRREDGEKVWCLPTELTLAPPQEETAHEEQPAETEYGIGVAVLDEDGRVPSAAPVWDVVTQAPVGNVVTVPHELVAPHDGPAENTEQALADPALGEERTTGHTAREVDVSRLRWMALHNGRWVQVTDLVVDLGVLMARISTGEPDPGLTVALEELR